MVHPGCDSPRQAWSTLLIAKHLLRYPVAAELSLHKRLYQFSHFSGKASAGAPDTRDGEALPENAKKGNN